jgi:hypothetical protein
MQILVTKADFKEYLQLTDELINKANDMEVINTCLILKKTKYFNIIITNLDFKYLFAENITKINNSIF